MKQTTKLAELAARPDSLGLRFWVLALALALTLSIAAGSHALPAYGYDDAIHVYDTVGDPAPREQPGDAIGAIGSEPFVSSPPGGVRASGEATLAARAGGSALEEASEAAFKASRGPINISRKHHPGAGGGYSKFDQGVDINATVREGLRSPGAIFRPNRNAAGDLIPGYRVYTDLGRTIGSRGETSLRTIVSPDGRVITSFPGKPWG